MYLMIDNYDSFVYNLTAYLDALGAEILIKRNDAITLEEIEVLKPEGIIISPGPKNPSDCGICVEIVKYFAGKIPILGVCLGHQIIGYAFGASIVKGKRPMHGKVTDIQHENKGLFAGLPSPYPVTRYHSLVVDYDTLPDCLQVDAVTEDGVIMGMSHKTLPIYSVQFHPEAVLTKYGHELLQNFLNLCKEWHQKGDTNTMKPLVKKSEHFCPVDAIFHHLYMNHADAVLLDSSLHNQYGEYSIIGLHSYMTLINDHGQATCNGEPIEESFEEYLSAYLDSHIQPNHTGLPIISGAIGYFNYDYGRKKEVSTRHTEDERMPESILKFYDNFIIESHRTGELFLTACGNLESAEASMKKLTDLVDTVLAKHYNLSAVPEEALPIQVSANFEKQDYMDTVERMRQYIIEGDIYIANMTQKLKIQSVKSPYDTFLKLRAINPSPFGAYMDYGDFQIVCASPERFMRVQSRQVETRPIKGTRKRSKDPQEDANLRQELQESGKDKSELLMIVDLERNDLHRVCETGSVQVTELFTVEAYATVFHLVSTIVGRLKKDKNIVDLLEATFPGGSITGAPKIRAMEIIDELEHSNRGLYTGSIGYIGLDGNCDLNIVIRTALHQDGVYYLGVGGGITYESELEFEYEETLQKAKAILDALQ